MLHGLRADQGVLEAFYEALSRAVHARLALIRELGRSAPGATERAAATNAVRPSLPNPTRAGERRSPSRTATIPAPPSNPRLVRSAAEGMTLSGALLTSQHPNPACRDPPRSQARPPPQARPQPVTASAATRAPPPTTRTRSSAWHCAAGPCGGSWGRPPPQGRLVRQSRWSDPPQRRAARLPVAFGLGSSLRPGIHPDSDEPRD
jgi:hypothetical protein